MTTALANRPSLRRALSLTVIVSGVLVLLLASSLVILTSVQSATSQTLAEAVENVRLAREAEIDLLLMARTQDPILHQQHKAELMTKLQQAQALVSSVPEGQALATARAAAERFVAEHSPSPALQEQAFSGLEEFVRIQLEEAREARAHADRIDVLGDIFGGTASVLFVVACVALLVWLRARAFQPLFAFAAVFDRFRRGEYNVRAQEEGPQELALMAAGFNAMASTLVRQREERLAFLAGVAHDLRNPLTALSIGLARAAPKDRPLPPEEKLRATLEVVRRQVHRLDRMVTDLLDAAHLESGRLEIRKELRDGRELVRDVCELFKETTSRHQLTVRTPDTAVPVEGDSGRLEQVLTNLVSNAIKYSPEGGEVEIGLRSDRGRAIFHVRDHGLGMAREDLERLFDPFRRSPSVRGTLPGVGLGLFVVKRIVEAHEGTIEVRSELGEGSTFEISLPQLSDRRLPSGDGHSAVS